MSRSAEVSTNSFGDGREGMVVPVAPATPAPPLPAPPAPLPPAPPAPLPIPPAPLPAPPATVGPAPLPGPVPAAGAGFLGHPVSRTDAANNDTTVKLICHGFRVIPRSFLRSGWGRSASLRSR